MYRASPPRKVSDWSKAAVTAAESAPSAEGDFVNLYASHMTHSGGFAQGVYAILPDKPDYDKLRFVFGPVTQGGTVTAATLAVWARLADGSAILLGTSDLSADGTFPSVEVENYQATYAVTVQDVDGTSPEITVDVFVQGVHEED